MDGKCEQEALLRVEERLLDIESEQRNGAKTYSLEELEVALRTIVDNG